MGCRERPLRRSVFRRRRGTYHASYDGVASFPQLDELAGPQLIRRAHDDPFAAGQTFQDLRTTVALGADGHFALLNVQLLVDRPNGLLSVANDDRAAVAKDASRPRRFGRGARLGEKVYRGAHFG